MRIRRDLRIRGVARGTGWRFVIAQLFRQLTVTRGSPIIAAIPRNQRLFGNTVPLGNLRKCTLAFHPFFAALQPQCKGMACAGHICANHGSKIHVVSELATRRPSSFNSHARTHGLVWFTPRDIAYCGVESAKSFTRTAPSSDSARKENTLGQ